MKLPLLSRFAIVRNFGIFIRDIGIPRFLLIQFLGGLTGILTVLSLSSLFGVLALFVSSTEEEILGKLSRYRVSAYIPEIAKEHLLWSALLLAFVFLILKLIASVAYSYRSTMFLENYAMRIRRAILDRYFETYGMLEPEIKETEILYFNHQLLRFVSYYVALLKANLEIFNSIFLFVFLLSISLTLSLVCAASLGILFMFTRPIHNFSKRMGKEYNQFVFRVEQSINRITRGIEILKTNNGKSREFSDLATQNEQMVRKAVGMDVSEKFILIVPEIMSLVLILCILSLESHFDKALIIAFLYSLLKLFGSLNQVNYLLNNALKLGSIPNEIHGYLGKWETRPAVQKASGIKPGKIRSIGFEDLRLTRGGKLIYSAEKIEFSEGDRVQIFGPNGCGKSSLVKAFLGLMPYQGRIRVNETDLSAVDKSDLFDRVSYLPQRFYLFNQSVLENLQVGNHASREEIVALLHEIGMDSFIAGLKDGLETVIAEDMKNLSGGQVQALSIARALLKRADVYILDEYGNNLDKYVKERVDAYLQEKLTGSILILITHLPIHFINKRLDFTESTGHVAAI
ncbi:MAG: ABC transporter ATP-binding protein [Fibrobacteria bacterium]